MTANYGMVSGSGGSPGGGSSIGGFGQVVFMASAGVVRTFDKLSRRSYAVYAEHQTAGGKPALEFTGLGLDEVSFEMALHASLGVNPASEVDALREMRMSGQAYPLTIGSVSYGNFVILEIGDTVTHTLRGTPTVATVQLSIKEYTENLPGPGDTAMARDMASRSESGKGGPIPVPGAKSCMQPRVCTPKG